MNIQNKLKKTRIQAYRMNERPPEPDLNTEIELASDDDFQYFENSKRYSERDVRVLKDADVCLVGKRGGEIVFHTCVALNSFNPPGTSLPISLGEGDSYVYNAKTETEYRGEKIFQDAHEWRIWKLYDLGVRRLYSEVDSSNQASLRATEKVGFEKCGERHTITINDSDIHIIIGENIYQTTIKLHPGVYVARTYDDRFTRITSEIEPYVEDWVRNDSNIVLFGAGNHTKRLLQETDIAAVVEYAIDDDEAKIGTKLSEKDVQVYSTEELNKKPSDSVVICSESFQNEMVERVRKYSENVPIITLYPHVSEV